MKRPSTDLWEKSYRQDMQDWVEWHINNTQIDNLNDFMRWFMQYSKGRMNPQTIINAWNEKQSEYDAGQLRKVVDYHIANVHTPFYENLLSEKYVDKVD